MMLSIPFSGHTVDRADHVRADPEALARYRSDPQSRLLVMDGLSPVLDDAGLLKWQAMEDKGETVFLGLVDGKALFAVVPGQGDDRPAYLQRPDWSVINRLSPEQLALYGGARSLVDWHARHRFCARCGAPTQLAKGGWQRDCGTCEAQHFPRTDPVAIMLVEHDDALLLGRGARFPERSFSALAGFIEPGESIEQGVAREVLEEVGVVVRDVTYVASQPWPFPSQLMIGCHAHADARDLTIDYSEIEDARWFTRSEVVEAMAKGQQSTSFVAPTPVAIAHHLLRWWLERD